MPRVLVSLGVRGKTTRSQSANKCSSVVPGFKQKMQRRGVDAMAGKNRGRTGTLSECLKAQGRRRIGGSGSWRGIGDGAMYFFLCRAVSRLFKLKLWIQFEFFDE